MLTLCTIKADTGRFVRRSCVHPHTTTTQTAAPLAERWEPTTREELLPVETA